MPAFNFAGGEMGRAFVHARLAEILKQFQSHRNAGKRKLDRLGTRAPLGRTVQVKKWEAPGVVMVE